ncbi:MAG: LPP20 family lipoprotein [Candidatus Cloacimonetes bacterium]|nr:LPP20 family lipoprotein [Candidatus Cloacimonadota bacterium]
MKLSNVMISILYLIFLVACGVTVQQTGYPSSSGSPKPNVQATSMGDLIIGVGTGSNYQAAYANAQADLASKITVKVDAIIELHSLDIEAGGKLYYSESIEQSTKLTVDQTLRNVKVESHEQTGGQHKVTVSISRTLFLNSLRGELDAMISEADDLFTEGQRMAADGRVLSAIRNFMDAQKILPDFYARKQFYDNFAPVPYSFKGNLSIGSLDSAIRDLLSSIAFEVVSGDKQTGEAGAVLPETIVFRAIYRTKGRDIVTIGGYPVRLTYGDNTLIEKGMTDRSGEYSINVIAIAQTGNRGKVVIRSDAFGLPAYLSKTAEVASGEAVFTLSETKAVSTQLLIRDEKGNRLEKVECIIAKTLNASNVQIAADAPLIMQGIVTITEDRMQEGMGKPQHFIKVRLDLQFGIARNSEIVGSISGTGQGLSTTSVADATQRAYDNISINSRELQQMLSAAYPRISAALQVTPPPGVEKPPVADNQTTPQLHEAPPTPSLRPEIKEAQTEPHPEVKERPYFDSHYVQSDDFFVFDVPLGSNEYIYVHLAKLQTPPSAATNNQAEFFLVMSGDRQWKDHWVRTRKAQTEDLRIGAEIIVFDQTDNSGVYRSPISNQEARSHNWYMTRITDLSDMYKGYVLGSGGLKIGLTCIRIIVR